MKAKQTQRGAVREVYRYSGLGCTFAAAVLVFIAGGWLLDRWLGVMPLFTMLGALVGAALGSVSIYRGLLPKADRDEHGDER